MSLLSKEKEHARPSNKLNHVPVLYPTQRLGQTQSQVSQFQSRTNYELAEDSGQGLLGRGNTTDYICYMRSGKTTIRLHTHLNNI